MYRISLVLSELCKQPSGKGGEWDEEWVVGGRRGFFSRSRMKSHSEKGKTERPGVASHNGPQTVGQE